MADIANFVAQNFRGPSTVNALGAAAELQGIRGTNALRRAQTQRTNALAQQEQKQFARQDKQLTEQERLANTQWLANASMATLQAGPSAVPSFIQEGKARGLFNEKTPQNIGANELKIIAKSARAALGGVQQQATGPASLQEFNFMSQGLSPEDQLAARRINLGLDARAGQTRILDVGGAPTQVNPSAVGQPRQEPLSTLGAEVEAASQVAGGQQAAKEQATTEAVPERARVEAEIQDYQQAPIRLRAAQDIVQQVTQLDPVFNRVMANANVWTVGFASTVKPPGSPAANMEADLNTLGANAAFDRLRQMKNSSPTGGALGQVSERELALLQSAVAAIAQSQSPSQFRTNVLRLKDNYKRIDALARQAQRMDRLKARVTNLRNRQTPEAQIQIRDLRNQIFSIEDEMFSTIDATGVSQPNSQLQTGQQAPEGMEIVGPNGQRLVKRNGQWVPL